jgi:hypothetical protein
VAHRRGESRTQAALFPMMLDDLVAPNALVRVVDAWIERLDLTQLGFSKTQPQRMGRPPYDPADLLKLYVCGYLSGVRSSRALERECNRNVEVMWLFEAPGPGPQDHCRVPTPKYRGVGSRLGILRSICASGTPDTGRPDRDRWRVRTNARASTPTAGKNFGKSPVNCPG